MWPDFLCRPLPRRTIVVSSAKACPIEKPDAGGSSTGASDGGSSSSGGSGDSSSGSAPPFPCTFTAPDGKYFDFSSMSTATGTQIKGVSSTELYMVNVCGATGPTHTEHTHTKHTKH